MYVKPHYFTKSTYQLYIVIFKKFESILITNFSVNVRFYFQNPVLNAEFIFIYSHTILYKMSISIQPTIKSRWSGVVSFSHVMKWFKVVYVSIFNKNNYINIFNKNSLVGI